MSHQKIVSYDPDEKVWKGPQVNSIYNPNTGLGEVILSALARTPNKVIQIYHDTKKFTTCKEIRGQSILVAENLKQLGYKMGDHVAVVCRNTPELAPIIYGFFILGTPVHCLDPNFTVDDLKQMFVQSKPKLVICESYNHKNVQDALILSGLSESQMFIIEEHCSTILFKHISGLDVDNYKPPIIPDPVNHMAVIMCSSGTTGPSKAVCLSHSHLIGQITSHWNATHDDSFLIFTTIYWISCVISLTHGTVSGMTRIITTQAFSPELLLEIVEAYKVTTIMSPPLHVSKLLNVLENSNHSYDLSSIRLYFTGGAFVSDDIRVRLQKFLKPNYGQVVVGLGMTEMGGLCFMSYPEIILGATGQLLPMMQAKIIDEEGNRLGHNQQGELCYKYPFKFLGYLGNEAATKDVIDDDGFVKSGDLGYFDENNQFYIVDRKKDIIKHMGHHVSPSEIETFLQKATGIMDICVVGIDDLEDYPAALIVKPENSSLKESDIIELIEKNLSSYKHLTGGCYFVNKLPTTPSGKIQRRLAKEYATKMYKSS